MLNKTTVEHKVRDEDGSLTLGVRVTLKLKTENKGDADIIIDALAKLHSNDELNEAIALIERYGG